MLYWCLIFSFLFSSSPAWAMGNATSTQMGKNSLIGKAAPDSFLPQIEGPSAKVIASRQGNEAVLVFWATWCPHCYEELGTLNDNLASIEQKGIKIILVDVGETKEDVKNYFNRRQMKLNSFVDENSVLIGTYHLIGVPTLVFIDKKGIVRNVIHEFPSDYESYFNAQ